ncbi:hypothetical protein [uncultured Agrobacterium sp.]|uniref:hypothetical protein n=1 Tax=uncultured Agrobacterium sp. TaxID=157277 RepID=UPI0025F968B6|nr:hypothetical protein [uncultured Agrobacterium sp.]
MYLKTVAKKSDIHVSPSRAAKISARAAVFSLMAGMIGLVAALSTMPIDPSVRHETADIVLVFGNALALATVLIFVTTVAQLRENASHTVNLGMGIVSAVLVVLLAFCWVVIQVGSASGIVQLVDRTYMLATGAVLVPVLAVYWWAMRIAGVAGTPGRLERYLFTALFFLPVASLLGLIGARVLTENVGFFESFGGVVGLAICFLILSFHRMGAQVAGCRNGVVT